MRSRREKNREEEKKRWEINTQYIERGTKRIYTGVAEELEGLRA